MNAEVIIVAPGQFKCLGCLGVAVIDVLAQKAPVLRTSACCSPRLGKVVHLKHVSCLRRIHPIRAHDVLKGGAYIDRVVRRCACSAVCAIYKKASFDKFHRHMRIVFNGRLHLRKVLEKTSSVKVDG